MLSTHGLLAIPFYFVPVSPSIVFLRSTHDALYTPRQLHLTTGGVSRVDSHHLSLPGSSSSLLPVWVALRMPLGYIHPSAQLPSLTSRKNRQPVYPMLTLSALPQASPEGSCDQPPHPHHALVHPVFQGWTASLMRVIPHYSFI